MKQSSIKSLGRWSDLEISLLKEKYPVIGLKAMATILNRKTSSVRHKASDLNIKQDRSSAFFINWQRRAATSKVGKIRPLQAAAMRKIYHETNRLNSFKSMTDEKRRLISIRQSDYIRRNGHPRGALGMRHSDEMKQLARKRSVERWIKMTSVEREAEIDKHRDGRVKSGYNAPAYKRGSWKASWREIAGRRLFFRSTWEANIARYLQLRLSRGEIKSWDYEAVVFSFPKESGLLMYKPDFLIDGSMFIEVKGWMCERSKKVIEAMALYYPHIPIQMIDAKQYKLLKKEFSQIINDWE